MAIVGSAQVVIRAITTKLEGDIKNGLKDSMPAFSKSGEDAGKEFNRGFSRGGGVNASEASSMFTGVKTAAKRAGGEAGDEAGREMGANMARRMARDSSRLENQGGGIGRSIGNAFKRGFDGSGAGGSMASIGLRIAALVPVLGALAAAISNVVSGLFMMAASAVSASKALIVIPSLLGAIVQGGAVMLGSFQGVGAALSAGMKAAQGAGGRAMTAMGNQAKSAARAVRDATQALKDARQQAADGIESAERQVADAERNLARAQEEARKAQEALNDARKEAKERLIDLQFAQEQGALAERRASMELADARWELNATMDLPPDNRIRQEAQLAYDEAELNLRMIKEHNGDNAEELEKVRKQGIDGMDEVVQAQENLKNAQEGVKEALQGVRDAEKNLAKARRDGAEAIRKAAQALADARSEQAGLNKEMAVGGSVAQRYQDLLANLSPPARHFVEYLLSMRDKLSQLRTAGQAALFPKLEQSIGILVNGLFPSLMRVMSDTGRAVGSATVQIARDFTRGPFVASFGRVAAQNATTIRRLGAVFGDLASVAITLLDAARPVTNEFTKWFKLWANNLRVTTEGKNKTGELTKSFETGSDRIKVFLHIFKNLLDGVRDFGKVAQNSGADVLMKHLEDATKRFADFTDKPKNVKTLQTFFQNTTTNFLALSHLLGVVGLAFLRLGANPGMANLYKSLEPVVLKLEDLITTMTNENGQALVDTLSSLVDVLQDVANSGAMKVFLDFLTGFFNGVHNIMNGPAGPFASWLLRVGAGMYAISIIRKFPGIKQLSDGIGFLVKEKDGVRGITRLKDGVVDFGNSTKSAAGKVGNFAKSFGSVIKQGSKEAFKNARVGIRMFSESASKAVRTSSLLAGAIANGAKKFASQAKAALVARAATIKETAAKIASLAAEKARAAATKIGIAVQAAFNAVMALNPFVLIILGIAALIAAFVLAYKKIAWFRDMVNAVFGAIVNSAKWLYNVLFGHSIFPDLLAGFQFVFSAIGKVVGIYVNIVMFQVRLWIGFFQNVIAPVIRWLLTNVVQPVFRAIGRVIGAVVPIIRQIGNVAGAAFRGMGRAIENAWTNGIRPAFRAINSFIQDKIGPAFKWLWNQVVKPVAKWIGDKISDMWNVAIKPAFQGIRNFINDKLIPAFSAVKDGITTMWNTIKNAAKAPVKFVIETIYNDGLRAALNKIPGVNLGKASLPKGFASGGVMPGYSPGRDIHKFFSPTGGELNLSGGEAIMRPEFTRLVGGEAGVNRLNDLAKRGMIHTDQRFADGGVYWPLKGATWSTYPGHDGIDLNAPNDYGKPIHAFHSGTISYTGWGRGYGQAVFERGSWGEVVYGHSSRIAPGIRAGTHVAGNQVIAYVGSTGHSSGPHLHFGYPGGTPAGALALLHGSIIGSPEGGAPESPEEIKAEKDHQSWLSLIKALPGKFKAIYTNVKGMGGKGDWYKLIQHAALGAGHGAVQWANDKIPDKIKTPKYIPDINLPNNPIPNPFDGGGMARGSGWMAKAIDAPERVLSPRQTEAFERLVSVLEQRGGQTLGHGDINLDVHVPQEASARDVVDGIVYELRRLEGGGRYA